MLHIESLTYSTNAMTNVGSTKEDASQKNILKFMHIFTNVRENAKEVNLKHSHVRIILEVRIVKCFKSMEQKCNY
jgi:hypothetical protein